MLLGCCSRLCPYLRFRTPMLRERKSICGRMMILDICLAPERRRAWVSYLRTMSWDCVVAYSWDTIPLLCMREEGTNCVVVVSEMGVIGGESSAPLIPFTRSSIRHWMHLTRRVRHWSCRRASLILTSFIALLTPIQVIDDPNHVLLGHFLL